MRDRSFYGDIAFILGLALLTFVICTAGARAQCPGGVCPMPPLPKVVKGEVSVVASRTIQGCRPKCECRYSHNSCKGRAFAGRRVMRRLFR